MFIISPPAFRQADASQLPALTPPLPVPCPRLLPPACLLFQGSMMTMDFRTDRVRCIYDPDTSLIVAPPRIG